MPKRLSFFLTIAGLMLFGASGCGSMRDYHAWEAVEKSCPPDTFSMARSLAEESGKPKDLDVIKEYIRLINRYGELVVSGAFQRSAPAYNIGDVERLAGQTSRVLDRQ